MRTTVTLDDDVAALLEKERQERGTTLKQAVNEALRVRYQKATAPAPARFRTPTAGLGRPRVDLDDVAEALDHAEGDERR